VTRKFDGSLVGYGGYNDFRRNGKFDGSLVGYRRHVRGGRCIVIVVFNVSGAREIPLVTEGEVLGVKAIRKGPESGVMGGERTKRWKECSWSKEQS
jgi:hypothetical protein